MHLEGWQSYKVTVLAPTIFAKFQYTLIFTESSLQLQSGSKVNLAATQLAAPPEHTA